MRLLVLSMLVAAALGMTQPRPSWDMEWNEWKIKFEKTYIEEEEYKRQMIWEQNRHFVAQHNYEYDLGQHSYRVGMNIFADLNNEEFRTIFLSKRNVGMDICTKGMFFLDSVSLPSEVDWRKKGFVTPVKNQLQCGSCWAFSATGSVEGQHFKKTGQLVSLSEQNLLDCSTKDGDFGCMGGLMDNAFEYIKANGVDTEASYPYKAVKGPCMYKKENVGANITVCVDLPSKDESSLQKAVAEIGPISVAIDASHMSFQLYKDGVYNEPACSQDILDHGVLAVGYGTSQGKDFWLVKNSWGASWGMEGYLMMSRNNNNNCGIATNASYPVV